MMLPGDTVLARTPCLPNAVATDRVSWCIAPLAAEYACSVKSPPSAPFDEMFTTDPPPARSISGTACLQQSIAPRRSTAKVRSHTSTSMSTTDPSPQAGAPPTRAERPRRRYPAPQRGVAQRPGGAAAESGKSVCQTPAVLDRSLLAPHALARWAATDPDRVAVEHVDGARLTFEELDAACRRWAAAYRRLGVGPGDHVATFMPNGFTPQQAWLGLGWLRAVEVPLNHGLRGRMLHYMLDNSDSTVLVVAAEFVDRLAEIADELPTLRTVVVVDGAAPSSLPFETVAADELLAGVDPATDVDGPEYRDI